MASILRDAPHNPVISGRTDNDYSAKADNDPFATKYQSGTARSSPAQDIEQIRVPTETSATLPEATQPSAKAAERHLPDLAMERADEDFAEKEYLTLIRWAVRKAPDLLRVLRIAYLFGQDPSAQYASPHRANPATGSDSRLLRGSRPASETNAQAPCQNLRDIERDHICRILKESTTVAEAALRLGINSSTLWRKRKRYNLS